MLKHSPKILASEEKATTTTSKQLRYTGAMGKTLQLVMSVYYTLSTMVIKYDAMAFFFLLKLVMMM